MTTPLRLTDKNQNENDLSAKEAKARIKINKLLEASGWRTAASCSSPHKQRCKSAPNIIEQTRLRFGSGVQIVGLEEFGLRRDAVE